MSVDLWYDLSPAAKQKTYTVLKPALPRTEPVQGKVVYCSCRAWEGGNVSMCQPLPACLHPRSQPQRGHGIHLFHFSCGAAHALEVHGRLGIKRRSVTPNRANKWQMLWNSLSPVTTEGLRGPRYSVSTWKQHPSGTMGNCFPLWSGMELEFLVSPHIHNKNTNRPTMEALNSLSVLHMVWPTRNMQDNMHGLFATKPEY